MIISSIDLYSKGVLKAQLSVDQSDMSKSYIITGASGLDVSDVFPRFAGIGAESTLKLYDMDIEPREVSLRIRLNPQPGQNQSSSSLRDALYRMISEQRTPEIELRFMNGLSKQASLFGLVQNMEASLFSRTPEVQISFICADPFLKSDTITLSNDVFNLDKATPTITDLASTAPHGFGLRVQLTANTSLFAIGAGAPYTLNEWGFVLAHSFLTNDIITIQSENNKKYVQLTRGSTTTSIADKIEIGSIWPMIYPGVNNFSMFPTSAYTCLTLSYKNTYWGV